MNFLWSAKSSTGETTTGTLAAPSLQAARAQIRSQGMFVLQIEEMSSAAPRRSILNSNRVTRVDLLNVTSQLAIMCRSGVDLADAVRSVAEQSAKPALSDALNCVYRGISDGKSVSDSLEEQSDIFGPTYIASVRAGEAAGNITGVLDRLSELLRNEIRLMSTIRGILAYPLVLVGVSVVVTLAIVLFVLPQFATVFENMNIPAPPQTKILLAAGHLLRSWWFIVLPAGGLTLFGAWRFRRTAVCQQYLHRLMLNAIVIKNAMRSLLAGRMFTLLGMMLESGIPLLESLNLCRKSIRNIYFHRLFDRLERDVTNGNGIGNALRESFFIPPGAAQMVATAERSGDLAGVMHMVGEFYEDEGERKLRDIVKLLEPAIIVTLGIVVGGIVMAVILPLLDVTTMHR